MATLVRGRIFVSRPIDGGLHAKKHRQLWPRWWLAHQDSKIKPKFLGGATFKTRANVCVEGHTGSPAIGAALS